MSNLFVVNREQPQWHAWKQFYRDNKIFNNFFPDNMTVLSEWPPCDGHECREFARRFVAIRVRNDQSRLTEAEKMEKHSMRVPSPHHRVAA